VARTRYVYRRRSRRWLAGLFDAAGRLLVRPPVAAPLPVLRRILILRLDHLGDVLFATPALRALRDGLPDAHLSLLVSPAAAALVSPGDLVDEVRSFAAPWFARPPRRGGVRDALALARWMRDARFDAVLDLRGDVRHLACMALARIPVRLGYGRTGGGFWVTHPVPDRAVHEVERNLDLVRVLVPGATAGPLVPPRLPPGAQAQAVRLLREAGCEPGQPLVVVHPGAGYPSKRWEPELLARSVEELHAAGSLQLLLVGGADDVPEARALASHLASPLPSLVGSTSLLELLAVLQRAAVFLGHDSGPAHLAVASGVPCVLLYSGVNDLAAWGPWQGRVRVFRTPVPCSPCGLRVCNRAHECMRDLDPRAVAETVLAFAGGDEGSHA
jgi:ADP-heptose:LPS heptosyltransferase